MYYKDKTDPIKALFDARLVPPDETYPDCVCTAVLTDRYFYILEKEIDGYTEHFVLPLEAIVDMEIAVHGKDTIRKAKDKGKQQATDMVSVTLASMAGSPLLYLVSPATQRRIAVNTAYFRIAYLEGDQPKLLFLEDFDHKAKKLLKIFCKSRIASNKSSFPR